MDQTRYKDGRLILSQKETFVSNHEGVRLRRVQTVFEDGMTMIDDYPLNEHLPPPYHRHASAPPEYDPEIPIVPAEIMQDSAPSSKSEAASNGDGSHNGSGAVTAPSNTASSQHQIAVVQNPSQAPPHAYSSPNYDCDDRREAFETCGWPALICFLIVCCCCVLPLLFIPLVLIAEREESIVDDKVFNDDYW